MAFWKKYKAVVNTISGFGVALGCLLLAAMSILVTVEVISRSFFGVSTLIADEFSCYFCVGLSFLGAAYAFKSGNFINVDIFYSRFPPKAKKWIDLILYLMAIAFVIFLFARTCYVVNYSFRNGVLSSGLSRTPLYIPQGTMAIGLAMFILQMTVAIGDLLIHDNEKQNDITEHGEGEHS